MLSLLGRGSVRELFSHIPHAAVLEDPLDLPEGMSELEVRRMMEAMASRSHVFQTVFRGAGAYRHYIPSVVKHISSKEDYVTAYTPYQAELNQGILQGIFEYQTMICELTGLDASNASVYDGATAAAEGLLMCREKGRDRAIAFDNADPQTIRVIRTYLEAVGMELILLPHKEGRADPEALSAALDHAVAAVYLQQPNYFGLIEDAGAIGAIAHGAGARYVMGCNPIALAVLRSPRECGADVAVGEGQPLGIPLGFGGPYLGFMACRAPMIRKLPGRIVGESTDGQGRRAFVLTLQAREQHIRREKAGSSICSNQALCALTAAVYMSAMGPSGLREAARQCMAKAAHAAGRIAGIKGYRRVFSGPFFHEFITEGPVPAGLILERLERENILGGYPLDGEEGRRILWCVTEMNTKEEIGTLVRILEEVAAV